MTRLVGICRCLLLALLMGTGAIPAWAQAPVQADAGGPPWAGLSAQQRQALSPLAAEWDKLPGDGRRKWMEIANRFPTMSTQQQQRVQQRMTDWARLSPAQRGEARVNFQQTQQLPPIDRQAQWEAYSALTPQERQSLAAHARKEAASSPSSPSRPLRAASMDAQAPKSNLVKPPNSNGELPKAVAPTLIQGGSGATTSLVTTRPAPPAHQTPGQPKITAAPDRVDRATLLPKPKPVTAAPQATPRTSSTEGGSAASSPGTPLP